MDNSIFREKSINRISSPEKFDEYVKVSTPGVWILLAGIVIFLAGVVVWGSFGNLETVVRSAVFSFGNSVQIYIPEESAAEIQEGMSVRIDNKLYTLENLDRSPVYISEEEEAALTHVIDPEADDMWVYVGTLSGDELDGGIYAGDVIVETIKPISLVVN